MAEIGPYHRGSATIAACIDFAIELGGVPLTLTPACKQVIFVGIKLTGTQRSRRGKWRLWWQTTRTCGRYYELNPVLPQSCASSSRTHAILAPADTVSICVRDALATCVDWQESQKKKTRVCLASDSPPIRLSHLPAEYERESRTLPPHRPS